MKYVHVEGADVPVLGLGTWRLAGQACYDMVRAALEIGYRHIDTAQTYFNEEEVGRAIRDSGLAREMVFLTTKLGFDKVSRSDVMQSTEESLGKLKTDYVDLLLIHWPSKITPLAETLETMADLHKHERVRHLGVSNFPSALLVEACGIARSLGVGIVANQVEYHPYLSQEKLLETCRKEDVMVTAYAPTARAKVLGDEVLKGIAGRHGKSPIQVTLRWLIQQEQVAAIPKSAHLERVKSNFEIFDFELSEEEMKSIFALARGGRMLNPGIAPKWDE